MGGTDKTRAKAKGPSRVRQNVFLGSAMVGVLILGMLIGFALGRGSLGAQPAERAVSDSSAATATTTPETPAVGAEGPGGTAPDGSALTTVTSPPPDTLAMIDPSKLPADAVYTVTLRPYGYGPMQNGATLVVFLEQAVPRNDSAGAYDFAGRNLLGVLDGSGDPITIGGSYSGTLAFREQGGLLVPVLTGLAPD